jgi:tRNA modification GTPase
MEMYNTKNEPDEATICAVSTPNGFGGVGIIRISGQSALKISTSIFDIKSADILSSNGIESRKTYYGSVSIDGRVIDDGIFIFFKAPNSFTGEDVVEIQLHGSPVILSAVTEELVRKGCEYAKNGEFSYRAFLNNKLRLSQAEEIGSLIYAKSIKSAQKIYQNLSGGVSEKIMEAHRHVSSVLAEYSVNIDYYDEDLPDILHADKKSIIGKTKDILNRVLSSFSSGHILNEGAVVVLAGYPNSGKSSLFNFLLSKDRALVSDIPGTTRDSLEGLLDIEGVPIKLIDTAGIRDSDDQVEKLGIARSLSELKRADIIMWLYTGSLSSEETGLLKKHNINFNKIIFIKTKIDIPSKEHGSDAIQEEVLRFEISVVRETGVEEVKHEIINKLNMEDSESAVLTSLRQKDLLVKTIKHLDRAMTNIDKSPGGLEILAEDLSLALELLDDFLGYSSKTDILDTVFKNFCVGK